MGERRYPQIDIDNRGANKFFDGFPMRLMVAYDAVSDCLRVLTTDGMSHFATNDIDKASSTVVYEGLMDNNGVWQIVQTTTDGNVTSIRFATTLNNPTVTSYGDAWTDRTDLDYGTYYQAFNSTETP